VDPCRSSNFLKDQNMTRHMKAAVVHQFGAPLSIEEVPVPEVGPGQILVNIKASGVCHTDLHAADGDWPASRPCLSFRAMRVWAMSRPSAAA
jgi:hypothetical protein